MRQVQAAEDAVPVAAIALGLPDMVQRLLRRRAGKRRLHPVVQLRQPDGLLVDLVALGVLVEEVAPEGAAQELAGIAAVGLDDELLGGPELGDVAGVLGPDHHFLVARGRQVDQAQVLLEKNILSDKDVNTPVRRIYFAVQLMYLDEEHYMDYVPEFTKRTAELVGVLSTREMIDKLYTIVDLVTAKSFYKALTLLREVLEFEKKLLAMKPDQQAGAPDP